MNDFIGHVDSGGTSVVGWCLRRDGLKADVHVMVNGKLRAIFPASNHRPDLIAASLCQTGGGVSIRTILIFACGRKLSGENNGRK